MTRIRTISHCVYREKSQSTANLCKAMCEASQNFEPLHFDQTGFDEDGIEYRYASLAAIKKATGKALAQAGVWLHSEYGFDERGRFLCVTVEKDDEWVASYLDIPEATTLRDRKSAMTQLRRAAIEGLLDLSAEEDTDGDGVMDTQPVQQEQAVPQQWLENFELASAAIASAASEEKLIEVMDKVEARIAKGSMGAMHRVRLNELCDLRRDELANDPKEVTA